MLGISKKMKKLWDYGEVRTAIAAVCAHTVSISIGMCQGYSAILIPQLMASTQISVDAEQASWIASLGAISNPVGSILSGLLAELLGRKKSMQVSSIPFIVGWMVIGTAGDIYWLYAGRLITGIAAGMATASYTYVAEISTPENRGILQALGPISASLGIFLTYTLGYVVPWNVLAYAFVAFPVMTLIGIQLVPESPSWLVKKDRNCETVHALTWFRRSIGVAERELEQLRASKQRQNSCDTTAAAYFRPETLKPFAILLFLFLCQELSGIYTILFYAVNFFKDSDVQIDEYVASMIVGFIRFFMSILAAFLISKYARKKLCMISASGMAVSMLAAAVYIKYYELAPKAGRVAEFVPLLAFVSNVLFSMIGMLPIPWILTGEMFSLQVRGLMSGLVVCLAQLAIFVCVKVHPNVVSLLNFSGALFIFAASSAVTVLFVKSFLPETKDMTLNDIESYFKTNRKSGVDNLAFGISSENLEKGTEKRLATVSVVIR